MKYKRKLCLAAAVLFALALLLFSTGASAQSAAEGLSASDVQCVVEPMYSFTAPPDAWLNYPDNRMTLGEFAVGELLLAKGERLSVALTPGVLTTPDGDTLPYTVSFSPPAAFDGSESGKAYNVAVEVDADAFRSAAGGTYTAPLLFEVVSHPDGRTVWQKQTVLTIVKDAEFIDDEPVPSTGFLASGLYLWCVAAMAAIGCIALLLIPAFRKAKARKKSTPEGADPLATGE